jgi:SNF2 family DNA or RNA helicase
MKFEKLIHKPWSHQADELEDYWEAPARALLWQMRTGKTKTIIDTLGFWHQDKQLNTVIIIAPNGVHENWIRREFPKHAFFKYSAHAWSSKKSKTKKHENNLKNTVNTKHLCVLAFCKEAILSSKVQTTIKLVLKKRGPCALIVDESHHFGKPSAKRTQLVRGLAKKCVMRRILSGTAVGNSPLRLFSQFEILTPGALGFTKFTGSEGFENRYAVISTGYNQKSNHQYRIIEGYQNQKELQSRVARWSSVVLRENCEDLPDTITTRHYYEPTSSQLLLYETVRKNYVAELESGSVIEALNPGSRLIKLQQILSNFTVTDSFEIETIDSATNPRIDALIELIDSPTIIWCKFTEDIHQIAKKLKSEKIKTVLYYGAISDAGRLRAHNDFQNRKATVFLGQPSCAGEGLDLSAADTIIWYSHVFDLVVRNQATERATVIGGNSVSVIDLVVADSIDEYILSNLEEKKNIAETITGKQMHDILEKCKI